MSQPLGTLSLFTGEPRPPSQSPDVKVELRVWLAVALQDLVLQAQSDKADSEPLAVTEPRRGRLCIGAASSSARDLGIVPGLKLSAALAISDKLRLVERSKPAEKTILRSLALSFLAITPSVSLEPPDTVLLEVRDSLKLFGGIREIKNRVALEIDDHGLSFHTSLAPTANGALWLVRDGPHEASSLADLTRCLRPLPLGVTAWPQPLQSRLKDMGISTIGDCLRLPRDGFARRIGVQYLRELDKALGREIDLRKSIALPQSLAWQCDFSFETVDSNLILEAAEHMLEKLALVLRQRQKQIQRFSFSFYYLHHEPDTETFDLIEPTHEKQRILDLFSVRLERLRLPFPVVSVGLRTGVLKSMQVDSARLFSNEAPMSGFGGVSPVLIERLRERLGPKSVHGLALEADHRPESAWRELSDAPAAMAGSIEQPLSPWASSRPLWLLPEPTRLVSRQEKPFYGGPVQLHEGPERIESGWWDYKDVRRDYYIALSRRGERLWIYFDRADRTWYLHGFFG